MYKKLIIFTSIALYSAMPDHYYDITNSKLKKQEFFNILRPMIQQANDNILKERNTLKEIFSILETSNNNLSSLSKEQLIAYISIPKKYKIKDINDKKSLLIRINTIPESLALAQASVESGWGNSRFIKKANNIFGHWTYDKSGLLPSKRTKGKTHRIRVFKTLQDSVNAYMFNLNKNLAYIPFRAKRNESVKNNIIFTGSMASEKMDKYSAIGQKYVKLLKSIIKYNKLEKNVSHETNIDTK